jgi:carboxyl-terminal processing protease
MMLVSKMKKAAYEVAGDSYKKFKPGIGGWLLIARGLLIFEILTAVFVQSAHCSVRNRSPYEKLDIFSRVLSYIEQNHVSEINEDELIYSAIKGMVRSLDPHSSFLTPKEFKVLNEDTSGKFAGVGLEVSIKNDVLTVVSPIAGSPAMDAGIESGDEIVLINDRPTSNMNIEEAVQLMRGKVGTTVKVSIRRKGKKDLWDIVLKKDNIKVRSVEAKLIVAGFAHIQIKIFQDGTRAELKRAIDLMKLEGGPLKGIVLDLRRNPGGLLSEAVGVSDLFLSKGTIVSIKGRNNKIVNSFSAHKAGTYKDLKVVVLIDAGSASASEIVAGALKDSGRAFIVGMKSFGKGSVQTIIPLNYGSGLKLTTAIYYTPGGKSIQAEGIVPDVQVESLNPPVPDEITKTLNEYSGEQSLFGHLSVDTTAKRKKSVLSDIVDYQLKIAFQILRGLCSIDEKRGVNQ